MGPSNNMNNNRSRGPMTGSPHANTFPREYPNNNQGNQQYGSPAHHGSNTPKPASDGSMSAVGEGAAAADASNSSTTTTYSVSEGGAAGDSTVTSPASAAATD
jgi:hypothetical protein